MNYKNLFIIIKFQARQRQSKLRNFLSCHGFYEKNNKKGHCAEIKRNRDSEI